MDEWSVSQFLAEEANECEWVQEVHFRNDDYEDPWFEIYTTDGDTFKVTVKKIAAESPSQKVDAFDDAI